MKTDTKEMIMDCIAKLTYAWKDMSMTPEELRKIEKAIHILFTVYQQEDDILFEQCNR